MIKKHKTILYFFFLQIILSIDLFATNNELLNSTQESLGELVTDDIVSISTRQDKKRLRHTQDDALDLSDESPNDQFLAPFPKKRLLSNLSSASQNEDYNSQAGTESQLSSSLSTVASTHSISSDKSLSVPKTPKTDFDIFCEIIKKGPYSDIKVPQLITAEIEDKEGSRKWVKFFPEKDPSIHKWHRKAATVIEMIKAKSGTKEYLPGPSNFAMARLVFMDGDKVVKEQELNCFFISGWPANDKNDSIKRFSKALANGKLGGNSDLYQNYQLRFITRTYENDKVTDLRPTRDYHPFKEALQDIIKKELEDLSDPLIGQDRLKSHLNASKDSTLLPRLYFHSEQAIWPFVKDKISEFKKKQPTINISHIFLDLCSYYDMCWCCGDTLVSCCHTNDFGEKLLIRATGCKQFFETPFANKGYALRDHREEFKGFKQGKAYEFGDNENTMVYKPFIAHARVEDLSCFQRSS